MTSQIRVRVVHPTYKAVANPLKKDLAEWIKKGWQKVPAKPPVNPEGEDK